jgi:GMP synthase-like glutamine amidotransferase
MKTYIGTKLIKARPMNRREYNTYRGWELPANEDGADEGFLVEYMDGGKANDFRHEGYISWSPADVFHRAYHEVTGMTFGHALEAIKLGYKVQRKGWNGSGLWLELEQPNEGSKMTLPYLYLNYPDSSPHTPGAKVPWLASQTDLLTDDWRII